MAGKAGRSGRTKGVPNGLTAFERLIRRTDMSGECWIWQGAVDRAGYGKIKDGEGMRYAHVIAYEEAYGLVPEGLTVDHLCRVKNCIRPSHLEAVTLFENIMRSDSCGAENARKKGCPHNHGAYDAVYANGHRYCRQCKAEREKCRRARRKED